MTPDQAGGQLTGSEFDWYADWFLAWDEPWREQRGALGFGAGVTVGTLADNGYTFATSVALVFSFPGPIIMLQGVGNILRPRSSLPDESTFTSLILFDGGRSGGQGDEPAGRAGGELLAALGMAYRLPADGPLAGTLLDAGGTAEASFDLDDAANWHIYLGQSPPEERIRAQTLSLFQADAYLTLEQPRLEAGASHQLRRRVRLRGGGGHPAGLPLRHGRLEAGPPSTSPPPSASRGRSPCGPSPSAWGYGWRRRSPRRRPRRSA